MKPTVKIITGLLIVVLLLFGGIIFYYIGKTTSCCYSESEAYLASISDDDTLCCCPHTTICLQPLDDFTMKEAKALQKDLKTHLPKVTDEDWNIIVLPSKKLNPSLMNQKHTRYRADKLCRFLEVKDRDKTIIGLTHHDISVPLRGHDDWGVMGLSFRPSTSCVISTYRVKNRSQLWKVAVHEYIHAFHGMSHCKSGDEHCIMQDAKGKNPLKRETRLCEQCKNKLLR